MQEILRDEFDDEEFLAFAIENYSEMFGYINTGRVNIRIHRDIEGKMWFGVGEWIESFVKWRDVTPLCPYLKLSNGSSVSNFGKTCSKYFTTSGSKCVPAPLTISSLPSKGESAFL